MMSGGQTKGGGRGGPLGNRDFYLPALQLEQLVGKMCHISRWIFPMRAPATIQIFMKKDFYF